MVLSVRMAARMSRALDFTPLAMVGGGGVVGPPVKSGGFVALRLSSPPGVSDTGAGAELKSSSRWRWDFLTRAAKDGGRALSLRPARRDRRSASIRAANDPRVP